MVRLGMTWGAALLILTCLSCAGEMASPDSGPTDTRYYHDLTAPDAPKTDQGMGDDADGGAGPDAAGDATGQDTASLGTCAGWSAWTCKTDPVYLCKASCKTPGGKQYLLSCTTTGHCVCGIATTPCGPYTFTAACDACRQAVEKGCCSP
jgi:hypothetical protein